MRVKSLVLWVVVYPNVYAHIFFVTHSILSIYDIFYIINILYIFFVTQSILSRYLIKEHGTDKSRFIPFPRALIQSK